MSWLLLIVVAGAGITSVNVTPPYAVGEYPSLLACKAAAETAVYINRGRHEWKPYDEAAICIERPASQAVTP
jgi:hypothetical protein